MYLFINIIIILMNCLIVLAMVLKWIFLIYNMYTSNYNHVHLLITIYHKINNN